VTNDFRFIGLASDMHQNGVIIRFEFINCSHSNLVSDIFRERDVPMFGKNAHSVIVASRFVRADYDDVVFKRVIDQNAAWCIGPIAVPVWVFCIEIASDDCRSVLTEEFVELALD
jgi:hypothetical protein